MAFSRRVFLGAGAASVWAQKQRPQILLRSSWQSVNIGDVGHTPGALSLLERYLPEAEITLWAGELEHGAKEFLERGYPKLKIVQGAVESAEVQRAWSAADLYLSGSGSGFPASAHALAFQNATGKPVGVFGVSTDPVSGIGPGLEAEGGTLDELRAKAMKLPATTLSKDLRAVIDRSAFFFCRDTISRDYLKAQGVKTPILEFGPDAQLGMRDRDEEKGLAFLKQHGLEPKRFIAVVPRLRYTPYYKIRKTARTASDEVKDAINDRTVERDHARLREMIEAYVRQTGRKVMACAEMTYQVELARQVLVDPLPADVKKNVVWRDTFWLPDEAASVYARAEAVVSVECHSPLIAYQSGTPAFYVRQPTDTCKGQMYRDFGAGAWFFEIDAASGALLWERLKRIVDQPKQAQSQLRGIMAKVEERQRRMVEVVREACAGRAAG